MEIGAVYNIIGLVTVRLHIAADITYYSTVITVAIAGITGLSPLVNTGTVPFTFNGEMAISRAFITIVTVATIGETVIIDSVIKTSLIIGTFTSIMVSIRINIILNFKTARLCVVV